MSNGSSRDDDENISNQHIKRKSQYRDRSPLSRPSTSSGSEKSGLKSWLVKPSSPLMALEAVDVGTLQWRKLAAEGLDCDYCVLLPRALADSLFQTLENELEYFSGKLTRVFVYGKWHDIPRQQVSFGEEGLSYKFSGTTVPARPWPPALVPLRDLVRRVAGVNFNFVLVNRYRDGRDHMGEHRDDEADLEREAPIASVSLGQARPFAFRHRDARPPPALRRPVPPVKITLEHGSLLMMNHPTNTFWYHSLPVKKSCSGVRINLTFRKMVVKKTH